MGRSYRGNGRNLGRWLVAMAALCSSAAGAVESIPGGNLVGQRGLVRSLDARNLPQGLFAVGTNFQYFKASSFLSDNQDHSRLVNTFTISWAPLSFLEAAFALHIISDESQQGDSSELQVAVGDPELALKGGYTFENGLAVGGALNMLFLSGAGFLQTKGSAVKATLAALASYRPVTSLPLSLHLNLGMAIDASDNLFDNPERLSAVQRYAAQLSSFHRFVSRVALQYDTRYVGPFVELSLEPFVGSDAPAMGDSPGILTFGAKVWPTKRRGLQLLAALDVGLTGVGDGEPASLPSDKFAFVIPRWNLQLRLSYRFDPFAPATGRTQVRYVARPAQEKPRGTIQGVVSDAQSGRPLWNARVKLDGQATSPLAVNPQTGAFETYGLVVGTHRLVVSAEGYRPETLVVEVKAETPSTVTARLNPRVRVLEGTIRGSVKSVGGGPVGAATVLIPALDKTVTVGSDGAFSVQLPPGEHTIAIAAPGHRPQRKRIRVFEGGTVILNVELYPRK